MRVRAPTFDDASAVFDLLAARDIADIGTADWTLEDLLDQWRGSEVHLFKDARVVEDENGAIVAYAVVLWPGIQVIVAPAHEGRGLGTRLREWAEQRDRQRGRERHTQWIPTGNERARTLLLAAGYEPVRTYWRMGLEFDRSVEAPPAPPGIRLRPLEVEADAEAVYALNEASFAGNADYRSESFKAFREEHLEAHDLEADLSCVAERDEVAVGFLLARRWTEELVGFVDLLGVHPDHRRQGLASAMLGGAFARFAAAGLREAQLGVAADNPRALRLYERSGMTPRFSVMTYERPATLSPA